MSIPFFKNFTETFFKREAGLRSPEMSRHFFGSEHYVYEREFYRHILPALSIQAIDGPKGHIRRFTPDGKILIVFCPDQHNIEILEYRGIGEVQEMLIDLEKECLAPTDFTFRNLHIRREIFNRLFLLRHLLPIVNEEQGSTHLNRDFCLFLDEGRFMLLASISPSLENTQFQDYLEYADMWDVTKNWEYCFYLIDMLDGDILDTLQYEDECITLSQHQGVGFHEGLLAVFLVYRQAIDLVRITDNNKFQRIANISSFGSPSDRDLFLKSHKFMAPPDVGTALPLAHLKQKILSFLYLEIMEISSSSIRSSEMDYFYIRFPFIENMLISKIQLIDCNHILIRYELRPQDPIVLTRNLITSPRSSNGHKCHIDVTKILPIYVLYNFVTQKILEIFERDSVDLFNAMRFHCDSLRNGCNYYTKYPCSSPNNNIYYRAAFDIGVVTINEEISEGLAYFNQMMPFSPQTFCCSPYLDYSLFSYDDRLVSNVDRPKNNEADVIEVFDRKSFNPQYRIQLEKNLFDRIIYGSPASNPKHREMVSFVFHPLEPFILSIQKLPSRYVINMHIYNHYTIVKKICHRF